MLLLISFFFCRHFFLFCFFFRFKNCILLTKHLHNQQTRTKRKSSYLSTHMPTKILNFFFCFVYLSSNKIHKICIAFSFYLFSAMNWNRKFRAQASSSLNEMLLYLFDAADQQPQMKMIASLSLYSNNV